MPIIAARSLMFSRPVASGSMPREMLISDTHSPWITAEPLVGL